MPSATALGINVWLNKTVYYGVPHLIIKEIAFHRQVAPLMIHLFRQLNDQIRCSTQPYITPYRSNISQQRLNFPSLKPSDNSDPSPIILIVIQPVWFPSSIVSHTLAAKAQRDN